MCICENLSQKKGQKVKKIIITSSTLPSSGADFIHRRQQRGSTDMGKHHHLHQAAGSAPSISTRLLNHWHTHLKHSFFTLSYIYWNFPNLMVIILGCGVISVICISMFCCQVNVEDSFRGAQFSTIVWGRKDKNERAKCLIPRHLQIKSTLIYVTRICLAVLVLTRCQAPKRGRCMEI